MINIYALLSGLAGGRVYRTTAQEGAVRPYIVWSIISNVPENLLGAVPEIDDARVQIDVYSNDQSDARSISIQARDLIEPHGYVVMGPIEMYESDTGLYRQSFDAEFWTPH